MIFEKRRIPKHLILKDPYQKNKSVGLGWYLLALILLSLSMFISANVNAQENLQTIREKQTLNFATSTTSEATAHSAELIERPSYFANQNQLNEKRKAPDYENITGIGIWLGAFMFVMYIFFARMARDEK